MAQEQPAITISTTILQDRITNPIPTRDTACLGPPTGSCQWLRQSERAIVAVGKFRKLAEFDRASFRPMRMSRPAMSSPTPLSRGGHHIIENCKPSCRPCNQKSWREEERTAPSARATGASTGTEQEHTVRAGRGSCPPGRPPLKATREQRPAPRDSGEQHKRENLWSNPILN